MTSFLTVNILLWEEQAHRTFVLSLYMSAICKHLLVMMWLYVLQWKTTQIELPLQITTP